MLKKPQAAFFALTHGTYAHAQRPLPFKRGRFFISATDPKRQPNLSSANSEGSNNPIQLGLYFGSGLGSLSAVVHERRRHSKELATVAAVVAAAACFRRLRFTNRKFDGDGELIVRASAVLKSQGRENWSRGRPGITERLFSNYTTKATELDLGTHKLVISIRNASI